KRRPPQTLNCGPYRRTFPWEHWSDRHDGKQRSAQGQHCQVKIWRPDRQLRTKKQPDQWRIPRSNEEYGADGRQKNNVYSQRPPPRKWSEDADGAEIWRSEREERERTPNDHRQEEKDEHTTRRVVGEGMDGIQ